MTDAERCERIDQLVAEIAALDRLIAAIREQLSKM